MTERPRHGLSRAEAGSAAPRVARRILEKLPPGDSRVSYSQDRLLFHILAQDGLVYLTVATEAFGRRIPFMFLEEVKKRFMESYGAAAKSALAYAYNTEFSRVLHQQMDYFNSNPNVDSLSRVKGEISEVKNVMVENIEKVLDRGEKIELLVDKTDRLQGEASRFRGHARKLKNQMWWKNAKMMALIAMVVSILLYFIIAMACGFDMAKCKHKH